MRGTRGRRGSLEEPRRRADVRVRHRRPLVGRDPDPVAAGGVDAPAAPRGCSRQPAGIRQVVLDQLGAELREERGLGRVADDGDDGVVPVAKQAHDRAPDETCATGDNDAHQDGPASLGIGETARLIVIEVDVAPRDPATARNHGTSDRAKSSANSGGTLPIKKRAVRRRPIVST